MALIWNDEIAKFVDLDEDWDKTEFVLVRKLFVKINDTEYSVDRTEEITEFTEKVLYERFNKYGPIENIEIVEEQKDRSKKYAYIQYRSTKDACVAYLDKQRTKKAYYEPAIVVMPADTWRQPEPLYPTKPDQDQDHTNANDIGINGLNENCLIKVLQSCDTLSLVNVCETSRKFRDVIHKKIFPERQTLILEIGDCYDFSIKTHITLGKIRRLLCCYGQYITEAELYFDVDLIDWPSKTTRLLEIFSKHVGTKIERLKIKDLLWEEDHINALKPVLRRIESLEITALLGNFTHKSEYIQDLFGSLALELSKLKMFRVTVDSLHDESILDFIRHAENLEEFAMDKCNIEISEKLIKDVVEARKELNITKLPLTLIVHSLNCNDKKLTEMLEHPEIRRFVKVATSSDFN